MSRLSLLGAGTAAIETVLDDVQIEGAEIDAAEVVQAVVNNVELEFLIASRHLARRI